MVVPINKVTLNSMFVVIVTVVVIMFPIAIVIDDIMLSLIVVNVTWVILHDSFT